MENKYYKAYRIIDGKPRFVIVNESGNVINRSPTKEELTGLEKETIYNQDTTQNRLQYTNEELLEYLRRFYKRNGRSLQRKIFIKIQNILVFVLMLFVLEVGSMLSNW